MTKTDIICFRTKRRCKELLFDNFVPVVCCLLLSVFCLVSETNVNNNQNHILDRQTAEFLNNVPDSVDGKAASMAREELVPCTRSVASNFEVPPAITVSSSALSNAQVRLYRDRVVTSLCQSAVSYIKECRTSGRSVRIDTELSKVTHLYMIKNLRI